MLPTGISYFDIVSYFFGIFFDSFILVVAFGLVMCCTFGSLVYLLYLKKDDQHESSLLNVLNGGLMILFSLRSLMEFTELFFMKVFENESFALVIAMRALNFVFPQICFHLTIATLLNHFR